MTEQKPIKELLQPIADSILSYRKKERMYQSELAKKAGSNGTTISMLEMGKLDNIKLDTLINILNACDIKVTRILI